MVYAYYSNKKNKLGQGKTSCLNGIALRMIANNMNILYARFWKCIESSEDIVLEKLKIKVKKFQTSTCFIWTKNEKLRKQICDENLAGLEFVEKNYQKYDALILDEILDCVTNKIISVDDFCELLTKISKDRIVCISGHYMDKKILSCCDLATEMVKIKHHFDKKIKAIKGVEY